ncbi:hypothetical protein C0992_005342 [Termitomyces sp. T32_za158]|nr:hypothetical protein C0992_005342 [Termitomyces sp. T32_za158]
MVKRGIGSADMYYIQIGDKHDWTFKEVLIGLYNRFVNAATMQEACEAFQTAVYDAQTGVQTFYDDLVGHAQNMAVYPDEFTIRETFLDRIPAEMRHALICDNNLSPEVNTMTEFLAAQVRAAHTAAVGSNAESDADAELEELIKDEEALQEDKELIAGDDAKSIQIDGDEYVAVDVYDNDYYARDDEEEHMFALTEHQDNRRIRMRRITLQKAADKLQRP